MKKTTLALASALLFGASIPAHAATIDLGTYSFSYDSSFWGAAFSNIGDTFTITNLGYIAGVAASNRGLASADYNDDSWLYGSGPAITITANSGYRILGIVSGAIGTISSTTGSDALSTASAMASTYANWVPDNLGNSGVMSTTSVSLPAFGSSSSHSQNYDVYGTTSFAGNTSVAYLTNYHTEGAVSSFRFGSHSSASQDAAYFSVAVAAIPEPESYVLMLGGLLTVAGMVRLRKAPRL